MGKIRKEFKNGFTTVSNDMYRDSRLSISERGLLGTMLSLPDNWDFSIKGLVSIVSDGERVIRSRLRKLEEAGYLKREKIIGEHGRISDWEYIFADSPLFLDEGEQLKLERELKKVEKELLKKDLNRPVGHFDQVEQNQPVGHFAHVEDAVVENAVVQNAHTNKYNKELNTNKSNTKELEIDRKIEKEIKKQINYEELKSKFNEDEEKLLDNVIEVLMDVNISADEALQIGKQKFQKDRVIETMSQLEAKHIEYVIKNVLNQNHKIVNVYNYLLKSLFTATKSFNLSKYSERKNGLPDWYSDTGKKYEELSDDEKKEADRLFERALALQKKLREEESNRESYSLEQKNENLILPF